MKFAAGIIKRGRAAWVTAFIIIASLWSCTAQENITLNPNGSGSLSLVFDLDPALIQYIIDVGEAGGKFDSADQAVIFDPAQLRRELLARPGVVIDRLSVPKTGRLELSLRFRDIKKIFTADKALAQAQVVRYVPGSTNTLTFHLDTKNFKQVFGLFPLLGSQEFKTLLPREGESKEDYFDVLNFALDNGSALVKNTVITLAIQVNGTVISQSGGEQKGNTVYFSLPLERVLFPEPPLELSLQFK
jgi:hypothetical protein